VTERREQRLSGRTSEALHVQVQAQSWRNSHYQLSETYSLLPLDFWTASPRAVT